MTKLEEIEETIEYFKKFGVEFSGFDVYIQKCKYPEFTGGDYEVIVSPEENFDQSFDLEPFIEVDNLEYYVANVWVYSDDVEELVKKFEDNEYFNKVELNNEENEYG